MMKMWEHGFMQKINDDIKHSNYMSALWKARFDNSLNKERKLLGLETSYNREPKPSPTGNLKVIHIVGGFIIMSVGFVMALISAISGGQVKKYETRKVKRRKKPKIKITSLPPELTNVADFDDDNQVKTDTTKTTIETARTSNIDSSLAQVTVPTTTNTDLTTVDV